jgi:hypothetical protein
MRFADYLRGLRDGRPFAYDQEDPPGEGVQDPTTVVIGPPDAHPAGSPVDVAELRCEAGASADVATDGARLVALYVLEGELILDATGEGLHAPAGTWIELEPGGEQRVAAGPGVDTRFLQVRAPA